MKNLVIALLAACALTITAGCVEDQGKRLTDIQGLHSVTITRTIIGGGLRSEFINVFAAEYRVEQERNEIQFTCPCYLGHFSDAKTVEIKSPNLTLKLLPDAEYKISAQFHADQKINVTSAN